MAGDGSSEYDFLLKLLLVGDTAVGKSSLLLRFTDGTFDTDLQATIGVDFKVRACRASCARRRCCRRRRCRRCVRALTFTPHTLPPPQVKNMRLANKVVKATIWDTAGQERFRTLTSSYYRGAHGVLLVYDVTRPETFQHLPQWLSEIETYCPAGGKNVVKLLVGNKSDLEADRAVSTAEGEQWARSKGMLFMESSAKSGDAVKGVFDEVVTKILESPDLLKSATPSSRAGVARLDAIAPPVQQGGSSNCC